MPESRGRPRRIIYTGEACTSDRDLHVPERWKPEKLLCVKYVDDCLAVEKVCFSNAIRSKDDQNNDVATTHASAATQEHFQTIKYVRKCVRQGNMKLYKHNKTKMLSILAAKSFQPKAFLKTTAGEQVESDNDMRVLGFYFDSFPNFKYHLQVTICLSLIHI